MRAPVADLQPERGQAARLRLKPEDKATENTMILNIERLLAGKMIEKDFDPSMGCSIKWKSQQT